MRASQTACWWWGWPSGWKPADRLSHQMDLRAENTTSFYLHLDSTRLTHNTGRKHLVELGYGNILSARFIVFCMWPIKLQYDWWYLVCLSACPFLPPYKCINLLILISIAFLCFFSSSFFSHLYRSLNNSSRGSLFPPGTVFWRRPEEWSLAGWRSSLWTGSPSTSERGCCPHTLTHPET